MLDVKEKEELCKKLSSIRMGEYRLRFNVARFVLEEGEIGVNDVGVDRSEERRNRKEGGKVFGEGNVGGMWHGKVPMFNGRSLKETLMGEKKVQPDMRSVEIDNSVTAFSSLHGRAVIVRMVDLAALRNITCIMKECGMSEGKVQYLGGVSSLISFKDNVSAVEAQEAGRKTGQKFSQISIWEGQSVGYERLAWLKV